MLQCLGWGRGGLIGNGTLPWSTNQRSDSLHDDQFASAPHAGMPVYTVPAAVHAINSILRLSAALACAAALVLGLMCAVVYSESTHLADE